MRPFPRLKRISDMMAEAALSMEVLVGLEAEVSRLRRGDLDALAELVTRYQHRLYRYLLRIVRQPAEAEDLFQQTWLRVAGQIRRFDPRRSFEAWLFTLARNLAIDHLRRVRPESLDDQESGDRAATPAALRSVEPPALDLAIARERAHQISAALEALPVIYREVLALRFEEEMKLEEIAEVLDAPLSTVKSRLRRGLESIRQELEKRYPGVAWQ
jgi:RNA polymerase sigma-70 factor, ECF subfamily